MYGNKMVFLPPAQEQSNNPKYGGCYDVNP